MTHAGGVQLIWAVTFKNIIITLYNLKLILFRVLFNSDMFCYQEESQDL